MGAVIVPGLVVSLALLACEVVALLGWAGLFLPGVLGWVRTRRRRPRSGLVLTRPGFSGSPCGARPRRAGGWSPRRAGVRGGAPPRHAHRLTSDTLHRISARSALKPGLSCHKQEAFK